MTRRRLPIPDTEGLTSFVPAAEIDALLREHRAADPARIRAIIQKSLDKQRLDPDETAALLNVRDPELLEEIFEGARTLKRRIYGNRIVLFAPLYIGNACVNDCAYCGFRTSNTQSCRRSLTLPELDAEVKALVDRGQKRLILVYGEHPDYDATFIAETVSRVYAQQSGNGRIRRVNINAAPLDVPGFATVKAAGIGTYQIFQETYHEPTYRAVHRGGPKQNYLWRLHALDRAQEAGIDDVGIGALLGLYDWRFEIMGLLYHTIHLEDRFNVGPHTISFPRIEPAIGTGFSETPPHAVSDADFKKLVAILRLAVPYTGLILTCREPVAIRNALLPFGVSQIDAGSSIGIGSYANTDADAFRRSQFSLRDQRSLDEVIRELCEAGFLPSFCTACYRAGRTGEHFMEFAIPGFVKRYCTPNAILTFLEYLEDYAGPDTRAVGLSLIEREGAAMPESPAKRKLIERIERIRAGERDLYF